MKKLYRKGTVHPSPPIISDQLSFLPAAIFTLAAALSPEDREVLAYLISCSNNFNDAATNSSDHRGKSTQNSGAVKGRSDHPAVFHCDCFSCYTNYWVRWDLSPNRQLIHEIIDAYEERLAESKSSKNNRKERKKRRPGSRSGSGELKAPERSPGEQEADEARESGGAGDGGGGCDGEDEMGKGSLRRIVNFIGERIWGRWS